MKGTLVSTEWSMLILSTRWRSVRYRLRTR